MTADSGGSGRKYGLGSATEGSTKTLNANLRPRPKKTKRRFLAAAVAKRVFEECRHEFDNFGRPRGGDTVGQIFGDASALLGAKNEKEWFDTLASLACHHGFEYTLFSIFPNQSPGFGHAYVRNNYPSDWLGFYMKQRLFFVEPLVQHITAQSLPIIWGESSSASTLERKLYDAASMVGARSGLVFPIHGPRREVGMLSLASGEDFTAKANCDLSLQLPALTLLRDIAVESAQEHIAGHIEAVVPKLTKREKECLKWMASGKSTWEMSQILSCSEATINFHMMNIRSKFGVSSRVAVVFKAARIGLLDTA
ncbi:helix-turn-helix transcriptional regulator [Pandoraea pulmonicola]|nr:autoinducer binding domain-containing protein [Pandoraea pulmonicola]